MPTHLASTPPLPFISAQINELQHLSILICTTYCNITPVSQTRITYLVYFLTVILDYTFLVPSLSHSPDEAFSLSFAETMAYDSSNYNYPDSSQVQYTTDHNHFNTPKLRPRSSSTVRAGDAEYPRQSASAQPPINEAVSSAFDKADMHYVDPNLVAHITENVIKQLKIGVDGATPVPQHKPFAPPLHQPVPQSPSTLGSTSPPPTHHRTVYTPPSPYKQSDYPRHESPDPPLHAASQRSRTPPPIDRERRASSPTTAHEDPSYTRPRGPARLSTGRDETTLEKIWGQLFDEESNPTPRLSQFLRGLAMHIVG